MGVKLLKTYLLRCLWKTPHWASSDFQVWVTKNDFALRSKREGVDLSPVNIPASGGEVTRTHRRAEWGQWPLLSLRGQHIRRSPLAPGVRWRHREKEAADRERRRGAAFLRTERENWKSQLSSSDRDLMLDGQSLQPHLTYTGDSNFLTRSYDSETEELRLLQAGWQ